MDGHQKVMTIANNAKNVCKDLASLTSTQKNEILKAMADSLELRRPEIKKANAIDMQAGKKAKLKPTLLNHLELTDSVIDTMINGMLAVAEMDDPIGKVLHRFVKSNGLIIEKVRAPIGVIGIIYESRPNVTADLTSLCLKTANAVILKGGTEALNSNQAIFEALLEGGKLAGLPQKAIQLIISKDQNALKKMVQMVENIDLIIPRGDEGLIKAVSKMARVPIIKNYKGLCHIYVDKDADIEKAINICENAKCHMAGVSNNAMETMLVHEDIAAEFLPQMAQVFRRRKVKLKGDKKTSHIISNVQPAMAKDWKTEYLGLILSIKVVKNIDEAIKHINKYGSHHSDAIISENKTAQQTFTAEIDSAAVYINASTRFTDAAEFGLGAEVCISTDKLHARGPMGLEQLTTYKYIILGQGQIRE